MIKQAEKEVVVAAEPTELPLQYLVEIVAEYYSEEHYAIDPNAKVRQEKALSLLLDAFKEIFAGADAFVDLDRYGVVTYEWSEHHKKDIKVITLPAGFIVTTLINKQGHVLNRYERITNIKAYIHGEEATRFACIGFDAGEARERVSGELKERILKYGNHEGCRNGHLVGGQFCDLRYYTTDQEREAKDDYLKALLGLHGLVHDDDLKPLEN